MRENEASAERAKGTIIVTNAARAGAQGALQSSGTVAALDLLDAPGPNQAPSARSASIGRTSRVLTRGGSGGRETWRSVLVMAPRNTVADPQARRRRCITSTPAAASSNVARVHPHGLADGTTGAALHRAPQRLAASSAHVESHVPSQQKESAAQTAPQQASDSQEGEPFASQQLPVPAQTAPLLEEASQSATASSAHVWSQPLLQQEPSELHTSWQQASLG
jgi:hypothetical protein